MNWEFKFITNWDTIFSGSFQQQWLLWVESAENSHVFFHPSLCMAWIESYQPLLHLEPLFCIAKMDGNTIFLPLVLWQQNWKNVWRRLIVPVGYSDFDYHDPLIIGNTVSTASLECFYAELPEKLLQLFSFDKFVLDGLTSKCNLESFSEDDHSAPFFLISETRDLQQLLKNLASSQLKKDLNRRVRRLVEKGTLALVQYHGDPGLIHLRQFLQIHSARWPRAFKAPLFHTNLLRRGADDGIVHFSGLHLDGQVISWHLGFMFNGRFYYYMTAIDPSWKDFSPGKIHLLKLMEFAMAQKLAVFDFLRGREAYKTGWTNDHRQIYQLKSLSGKSISGLKELAVDFKNFLRK